MESERSSKLPRTPIVYCVVRDTEFKNLFTRFQSLDFLEIAYLPYFQMLPLLPAAIEDLNPIGAPFLKAAIRIQKMPFLNQFWRGEELHEPAEQLLTSSPITVLFLTGTVPPWLPLFASKKPLVVASLEPEIHHVLCEVDGVNGVLLKDDVDVKPIYSAIGSVILDLMNKGSVPKSIELLSSYAQSQSLFLERPKLDFMRAFVLPAPDKGRPAAYLLNRMSNNVESLGFGQPIDDFLSTFKYATHAGMVLALIEGGGSIPANWGLQRKELEMAYTRLRGTEPEDVRFKFFLDLGKSIASTIPGRRYLYFLGVPAVRPGSEKAGARARPAPIPSPPEHAPVILRSVRDYCQGEIGKTPDASWKHQVYATAQALLDREQEMLAAQSAILAGAALALPDLKRPIISHLFPRMNDLQNALRAGSPKTPEMLRRFQIELSQLLPPPVRNSISSESKGVVIYSDLPFEWALVDDFPLCFHKPVSRIPIGMSSWWTLAAANQSPKMISTNRPDKVLVLDLFAKEDPLRQYVEMLKFAEASRQTSYTYVASRSRDELGEAFRIYDPDIVLLEGHGKYDHFSDKLYITAGSNLVDVDNLLDETLVPKIWILSACETAMTDAVSGCLGRKLLGRGAVCVIGTLARVDAFIAHKFVLQLLANIYTEDAQHKRVSLDDAFLNAQVATASIYDPLLPIVYKAVRDSTLRVPISKAISELMEWSSDEWPLNGMPGPINYLKAAAAKLDTVLAKQGLLTMAQNLRAAGRVIPESLFFSAFGTLRSVKLV